MSVAGGLDDSTKWSRSGFKDTFKRGRKNTSRRGSDSNSASSTTLEKRSSLEKIKPSFDGRRRSSTESSSALKKVLSGGRRGRLGNKNDSSSSLPRPETSGSTEPFRGLYNSSTEGPLITFGSEDAANFTEDDENENP